jgi:hypothetical protein
VESVAPLSSASNLRTYSTVVPGERLSRYVFEESYYRADGSPKPKAFYPDKDNVVSVFRIDGLTHAEVIEFGDKHVTPKRNKPLHGHVEITAASVRAVGLDVASKEPPLRHAEIFNFPDARELAISKAQELAAVAIFRPCPK